MNKLMNDGGLDQGRNGGGIGKWLDFGCFTCGTNMISYTN